MIDDNADDSDNNNNIASDSLDICKLKLLEETWSPPRVHCRALIVHNLYQ
jgi:hypothetical protein